jgi:hypothetical protein
VIRAGGVNPVQPAGPSGGTARGLPDDTDIRRKTNG